MITNKAFIVPQITHNYLNLIQSTLDVSSTRSLEISKIITPKGSKIITPKRSKFFTHKLSKLITFKISKVITRRVVAIKALFVSFIRKSSTQQILETFPSGHQLLHGVLKHRHALPHPSHVTIITEMGLVDFPTCLTGLF